jgi:adenine C2-methylase RlmN of 23S rRNA A2503 and tRNA A37
MKEIKSRKFLNGIVYHLKTQDGFDIETTDTFLPYETIKCDYSKKTSESSRKDRWMIGISTMSGCPIRCRFCATGNMKNWRSLTFVEMLDQIDFITEFNYPQFKPKYSREFKINYTRMGEPFLNIENVKKTVEYVEKWWPSITHHYISTIGVSGSDFSWIKDNITLQISLHSLDEKKRRELIPYKNLMTIDELGKIRTKSKLKTTINMTLVDQDDFCINKLTKHFDPEYFFIKLSPINNNSFAEKNGKARGVIDGIYN